MHTGQTKPGSPSQTEVLTSAKLVRRRILLKGVGKGSAILAATVPIQTLASQSLLTFDGQHQCSISGMHSGVHSATTTPSYCGGYTPGWWGQKFLTGPNVGKPKHWPPYATGWSLPAGVTYKTPCRDVFTGCHLVNTDGTIPTLWQIMEPKEIISKFENTDEFHWVCAWLNALSHSFNFPYTGSQVVDYYRAGVGSPAYEDALTFFKTYMEKH